ncbi:MAG: medium chain dehydrogenase/reductase family protein [Polyangiales bacterium]
MKAIVIRKHGGFDVLSVDNVPTPEPKAGEVRVAVKACGLNFAEIMARKGLYPDAPKPPMIVGYEVSGVVNAVGKDVKRVKVGDRVAALTRFNGHAEFVVVAENQVFALPSSMSFEAAAALPVNYLTAYHMLFQVFRVREGDTMLIHAVSGGVGTAVCQLARTVKNVTVFGTASAKKHDYARANGCDFPIDYRSVDYAEVIRKATNSKGVDLVMDALGGPDWKKGYSLLRPSGMLIAFGWSNMSDGSKRNLGRLIGQVTSLPFFTPIRLMDDNKAVAGVNVGHLWDEISMLKEQADALMRLFELGKIEPKVDKIFSFEEAAEAHRYLESGQNLGKVLLVPRA